MKKYVLSAVVTGILVPAVYAMDEGTSPAAEIEVPVVEVAVEDTVSDEVAVEEVVVEDVVSEEVSVDGDIEVTTLEFTVDESKPEEGVAFDGSEMVRRDLIVETGEIAECLVVDEAGTEAVDENGEPVVCTFEGGEGGELYMMTSSPSEGSEVATGGEVAEHELVDPNVVELSAQSGVVHGGEATPATEEVTITHGEASNDDSTPVRAYSAGGIQPNFRGGAEDMAANNIASHTQEADSNAQLLNDEQRGAVRGLRVDAEPAKSRSGLGKFLAKFRKPKSDVTLASATNVDKALSAKLAEIDRMRDTALRTGDKQLLAKADKLEKELRAKSGKATKIKTRTK